MNRLTLLKRYLDARIAYLEAGHPEPKSIKSMKPRTREKLIVRFNGKTVTVE